MANNIITETLRFKFNTIARDQSDVTFLDWRDLDLGTRADSNMQKLDTELYKILKRGLFIANTTTPSSNQYVVSNSAIVEMFDKMALLLIPNADNTSTTTLQINSFVSSPLKKVSNNTYIDIVAGDLKSKQPTLIYYDLNSNVFVLASALVQSASTTQSGIVQLSNETNSTDETKAVTPKALKDVADAKLDLNQKGQPNGVASLDTDGKISLTQIPDAILGSLKYIDTWDASGGTTPSNPKDGNYWVISVAGVIDTVEYNVKDWLIYNASTWSKLDGEDSIEFATQTEAETGTNTTKVMSPLRVFQSIAKWVSDTTVSALTTTAKTIVGSINELSNKIGILSTKIDSGVTNTPTVNIGMNNVFRFLDYVTSYPKFTIQGKSYVNLLGKDGNCEDLSKWATAGTVTLDTTKRVYGSNCIKIVTAGNYGNISKPLSTWNIVNTKYYLLSSVINNVNGTVSFGKDAVGGGTAKTLPIPQGSSMIRYGIKLQPSEINIADQISLFISSSTGQTVYIDGIMVNEITADEYNNLTTDQLLDKYPYVDSYACLQNPYIEVRHDNLVRNGNCEDGIGYWTQYNTNASISIENNKFKVVTSGDGGYYQKINVKANTNYYINGNATTGSIQIYSDNFEGLIRAGSGTFNTGSNTIIVLYLYVGTNTAYFDSIMLIESTTAPTEYKPCRIERCVIEGKFTSDDSFTYENGEVSGLLNWKHKTLYGKDYDWQYHIDGNAFKQIYIPNVLNLWGVNKNAVPFGVKYNGSMIKQGDTGQSADIFAINYLDNVYLSISDTDTGWAETIAPNADEIKAFMNGWKAVANDGTRYRGWKSIVDGKLPITTSTCSTLANAGQNTLIVADGTKFTTGRMIAVISGSSYGVDVYSVSSISGNTLTLAINLVSAIQVGAQVMLCDGGTDYSILTYCKNNIAPNYVGYQLHYKLANPEPITNTNIRFIGDIIKLD